MNYQFVTDEENPHLGGNLAEGDPCTHSPSVWRYLIDRFATRSVMDLGSGLGYAAMFFHRAGQQVVAVDGLERNVRNALFPTLQIDLTKQAVTCNVDLVHCQEVAEHIEEKFVNNFIDSLRCGRFVVMSHGEPGQGGHHHINLQDWRYWNNKMQDAGYHMLPIDTERVRKIASQDGADHLARSGLVFARNF